MKKNKSVPNLRTSKQNKPYSSPSNEQKIKGTLLQNLFGVKNRGDVNFSNTPVEKTKNESSAQWANDSHSYRKFMSEPVGTSFQEDDNNKGFSVFKKLSIRLGGSKKSKQKLKSDDNVAVVEDLKLSENVENNKFNYGGQTDAEISLYSPGFVRQRKSQMSMRKAFGIFEDDVSNAEIVNAAFETKDEARNNEYLRQLHKLIMNDDVNSNLFENNPNTNSNASDKFVKDARLSSDFPSPIHGPEGGSSVESNIRLQESCNELMEDGANCDVNFDSTLKPDHYANQLREQARRLSMSKHSEVIFNLKRNKSGRANKRDSRDSEQVQHEELQHNLSYPDKYENETQMEIQDESIHSVSCYFKSKQENDYCPPQSSQPLNKSSKVKAKERTRSHRTHDDKQTLSMVSSQSSRCQTGDTETVIGISYIDDAHKSKELRGDSQTSNDFTEDIIYCEHPETPHDQVFHSPTTDPPSLDPPLHSGKSLFLKQRFSPVKFTPDSNTSHDPNKIKILANNRNEPSAKPSKTRRKRNSASSKQSPKVDSDIPPSRCQSEFNRLKNEDPDVFNHPQFTEHNKEIKLRKISSCDNIRSKKLEDCELKKNLIRKMSVEKRVKLSEEKECEEFSSFLSEKLKLIDPQLSTILSIKYKSIQDRLPSLANVCYSPGTSEEYTQMIALRRKSSEEGSKQKIRNFSAPIGQEKNEMENMLVKKIDVLYQEKNSLERKIVQNNDFGVEACKCLSDYLDSRQVEKFLALAQEMEKVIKLILKLGNMLTRTEESYLNMPHNSTDKEKAVLHNKMESLKSRLNEAQLIKESVDAKYEQILCVFHAQLPSGVTKNFDIFLTNKSFLMIDLEELTSEICLTQAQLHSLRSTMTKNSVGTNC